VDSLDCRDERAAAVEAELERWAVLGDEDGGDEDGGVGVYGLDDSGEKERAEEDEDDDEVGPAGPETVTVKGEDDPAGVTVMPRPPAEEEPPDPERSGGMPEDEGLGLESDEDEVRLARSAPRPRADEGDDVLRGEGSAMAAPEATRVLGRRMESRVEGDVNDSVDKRFPLGFK
jgi:hypothetical protein